MQKVLDKELAKDITEIIKNNPVESAEDVAEEIVEFLRETQDAGGMKVCQNKNW